MENRTLPPASHPGSAIILYDGVCGLCNRLNRFVLRRDRKGIFRFAPLQGRFAREALRPHGRDPADLDTFCIILDPGQPTERVLVRGRAAREVLRRLEGFWGVLGSVLRVVPVPLLDLGYRAIARVRYRVFGKHETCPLPDPRHRERFIDV